IFAESRELLFLQFADFSCRIEDDHFHARYFIKTIGYRTACISGGGDQHPDFFFSYQKTHQLGAKARPKVLKGQGGTMKQFQGKNVSFNVNQRCIKSYSMIYQISNFRFRKIILEKSFNYFIADLPERQMVDVVQEVP